MATMASRLGEDMRASLPILLLALASFPPLLASAATATRARPLAVIVHPDVGVECLAPDDLQDIFLRRSVSWPDGTQIFPLNRPPGHPLRLMFDRVVLRLEPQRAAQFWMDLRSQSGIPRPRALGSSDAMLAQLVASVPGSIAYIRATEAPDSVRVVARIEGGRVLDP